MSNSLVQKIKQNRKRVVSYLRRNGVKETFYKVTERMHTDAENRGYHEEALAKIPTDDELARQSKHSFIHRYKFSILVPTYETDPVFLRKMVKSVTDQSYSGWELCIADGSDTDAVKNEIEKILKELKDTPLAARIKYQKLEKNEGISANTNACLQMATGEYVGLLDHDDALAPNALYEVAVLLNDNLQQDNKIYTNRLKFIYTDEDKVNADDTVYFGPHYKPDFDLDLLRSNNYICHFCVIRTELIRSVGGFRDEYNGAQDHDLFLRCVENIPVSAIGHIDKVLYHWRSHELSTAENPDSKLYAYEAGKRAVEDHLKRKGIRATVEMTPHLGFFRVKYQPLEVSIRRLNRQEWDEITAEKLAEIPEDYIMILSDELKPLSPDYFMELAGHLSRFEVGAVGGKIYDRFNRIESAGYDCIGEGFIPRFKGLSGHYSGYMHRASLQQRVDGLSLDCMMVRKSAIEFKDKPSLAERYLVVFDPYAEFRRR